MPTDAVVLEHDESVVLTQGSQTLIELSPVPPGRSYLIWAKGEVFASNAHASFQLDAFGSTDSAEIGFGASQGQATLSLVVAATLPPDEDVYKVAKLTGQSRPFAGEPATGLAVIRNVKLVVLAVDTATVQAV